MSKRLVLVIALLALTACSKSNNLLLGRVEATVGPHTVVVTDRYRTSPPQPQQISAGVYHYMPCRDADIWIRAETLTVNHRDYGPLAPTDSVLVDHSVVSIQRR
jgi:hypothetical protein